MAYYTPKEMKQVFKEYPQYKDKLYCRGFLISTESFTVDNEYPFLGNWNKNKLSLEGNSYYIYTHNETYSYTYSDGNHIHFLIGHAYDPFNMEIDENNILKNLANALNKSEDEYWDAESNLTGVFCVGYFSKDGVVYSTDCTGMQLVYYGCIDGELYITSHSKLVADLKNLEQTEYIKRLVSNRFWHYFGTWLPGDLSPYSELTRLQPNFECIFDIATCNIRIIRYYPVRKIEEIKTEEEYEAVIKELSNIMHKTMSLIAEKWSDKKISISVTGGRDSMTTLSCTNGMYDKFKYFSYISNVDESVDADASKKILEALGLERELFVIPEEYDEYKNIDAFKKVMQCNAGCIGENNLNDVKKRLYLSQNPPCDIEVKSWVNEMGRGWFYNKYNKKSFPKYPSASYLRTMHKLYLNPWLIKNTDKIFKAFLNKYYNKDVFDKISWVELLFWEFSWSGGEGVFLTSEHRVAYDITIPFNNRKYVDLMLRVPVEKRRLDNIPDDIINLMEPRITKTGIMVKDISHTDIRALEERIYLEIFSRIHIF